MCKYQVNNQHKFPIIPEAELIPVW